MSQNSDALAAFALELNREVQESADEALEFPTEVECFARYVCDLFDEAGIMDDPQVAVSLGRMGRSPWELAGWSFPPSENEDLSVVSILAVLHYNDPAMPSCGAEDLRRRFELVVNFVNGVLQGRADELEPAAEVAALGRLIALRQRKMAKVVVHLATDGLTKRLKSIESVSVGGVEVSCEIWDVERLSRLSDPTQEDIDIDVRAMNEGRGVPCLQVPEDDPDYDAFLCVVPGVLLFNAYEQYGQRLLELNVRSFLSATGSINKGIRETIRASPDRFFAYNNGLALTARRVEIAKAPDGRDEIVRIVGLQIVNGGQTTVSLYRAWKVDNAAEQVRRAFVQAKLTVITTAEGDNQSFTDLVKSISKFANSQNAVRADDLEANQPWHVRLEQLSRSTWTPSRTSLWYYERSRGSYAVEKARYGSTRAQQSEFEKKHPRDQLITKTDLAKCVNAWSQFPHVVSLGGQKNFAKLTKSLGDQLRSSAMTEKEYKHIVAKSLLLRSVTKIIKSMKDEIPAYQGNVVAYLVSYLSYRMTSGLDFEEIWNKQSLPAPVVATLRKWAVPVYRTIVTSAGSLNVTEWCKKEGCWNAVKDLDLDAVGDLSRFAGQDAVGRTAGVADQDEARDVAECLSLSEDDWAALLEWVAHADGLHFSIPGILSTLRSYAVRGWAKRPTPKQARASARIIRRWREETS
jgi:hypothetical protein